MHAKALAREAGRSEWALVFEAGDEVIGTLVAFARERGIRAGHFTAVGAFRRATLAYFRWESRRYEEIPVDEQVEVTSFTGDIAMKDGEPAIHGHCVLGRPDGRVVAGHLRRATVRPTLELFLTAWDAELVRRLDPDAELPLIQPDEETDA